MKPGVNLAVFICLVIAACSWNQPGAMAGEKEIALSKDDRVTELETRIQLLEEQVSLYLENLGACIEENKELEARLKSAEKTCQINEEKLQLIEHLSDLLGADQGLGFLGKLQTEEIRILTSVVLKRLNRDSGD